MKDFVSEENNNTTQTFSFFLFLPAVEQSLDQVAEPAEESLL